MILRPMALSGVTKAAAPVASTMVDRFAHVDTTSPEDLRIQHVKDIVLPYYEATYDV